MCRGWILPLLLLVGCTDSDVPAPETTGGFSASLESAGIRFEVRCPNSGSLNSVRIVPDGLEIDNRPQEREVDGIVTDAEVADLNGDGSPEIYVYVQSAGSGAYGSLVAFSANRRKSLSDIYLPPLHDDPSLAAGYMGHDRFTVENDRLIRRFPIYRENDPNVRPTGGTREVRYALTAGEAGWRLEAVSFEDIASP